MPSLYRLQTADQCRDVRRAAAGGVIPAGRRRRRVHADDDVVEGAGGGAVERPAGESERTAAGGLGARPDALPGRRARARAADRLLLAADDHLVAAVRVGVERDVGHAARDAEEAATRVRLPVGRRLGGARAAAPPGTRDPPPD